MTRDLRLVSELQPTDGRTVPAKVIQGAADFVNWLVLKGLTRDEAVEGVRRFIKVVAQKPRQVKALPAPPQAVRNLLIIYQDLYRQVYGEALARVPETEVVHLARLAREYAAPVIEQRLRAFARYVKEDAFMARLGFKPSTLVNQWVRVTAYAKQNMNAPAADAPRDCHHTPRCRNAVLHTQRLLQDHRRTS